MARAHNLYHATMAAVRFSHVQTAQRHEDAMLLGVSMRYASPIARPLSGRVFSYPWRLNREKPFRFPGAKALDRYSGLHLVRTSHLSLG